MSLSHSTICPSFPRSLSRPGSLLAVMLLAGCSSSGTPPPLDSSQASSDTRPVALVTDGCVMRDQMRNDYFVLDRSRYAGERLAREVSGYLASQAQPLGRVLTPFACGIVNANPDALPRVAMTQSSEALPGQSLPRPLIAGLEQDSPRADAYHALIRGAANRKPTDDKPEPLPLNTQQLALLRTDLGAHQTWLAGVLTVDVSASKSFGTGLVTGIVSFALSGGMLTTFQRPTDNASSWFARVDLDSGQLVWRKNQQGIVPYGESGEAQHWLGEAFTPMVPPPVEAS